MATLQRIADELGVSPSTVSRVVNKKGNVKESTCVRVMEAIDRYNYVPDNAARSLKTGQTKTIGVIIPDVTEIFFTNILRSLEKELSNFGYNMLLCISGEDESKEEFYLNYLTHTLTDGIILATVAESSKPLRKALTLGKKIVCIDNLPGITEAYDSVISDNIHASKIAIEHLYTLGHRRIAAIVGKQKETTGIDRLLGYRKAMQQFGLAVDEELIRYGDYKEQSGRDAMIDLLDKVPDITAVYVASSKMTYGAMKAILNQGKKVSDDISVVGFDIHDLSGLITPGITTISQNEESIGKLASQLVLEHINQPKNHISRKIVIPPELLIRDSCRHL